MTVATLERRRGAIAKPQRAVREFAAIVRHDGKTQERTVWAPTSIDATVKVMFALERDGITNVHMEVRAL